MAPMATRSNFDFTLARRDPPLSASVPEAPPVTKGPSNADGFSPAAIIGIVAAIVIILILIPLIAIVLRRQQRKRCLEMLSDVASNRMRSSGSSVREEHGLKSILVTKELQRSSLRMSGGVRRPEEAHIDTRGWSRIEVTGGDGR